MNESNRTAIVLLAALWIVLMAVVIFAAWAADAETVERLDDFVRYLDDQREFVPRLILTLGAMVLVVLALLVIILELAPEEEERQIKVEQAGATTIVPAEPLRLRLEEALTAMEHVTAARARVFTRGKGIGMKLALTVTPDTNIAVVTQEASRVVVETLQADLGLPVSGPPTVSIAFGPPKAEPVASSLAQPPVPQPPPVGTGPEGPAAGGPQWPPAAPATPAVDESAPGAPEQTAAPQTEVQAQREPPASGAEAPSTGETEDQAGPPRDEPQQH